MKLSKYIAELQKLQDELGDVDYIYTAKDAEGNGYNPVHYKPSGVYVLRTEARDHIVESLIFFPDKEETREDFLEEHEITEAELKTHYVVGVVL